MVCQTSNSSLLIYSEGLLPLREKDSSIRITFWDFKQPQASESPSSKELRAPSCYFAVCTPFGGTSQIVFAQTAHQLKSTLLNQPSNRSRSRCVEVCVVVVLLLQETRPASSHIPPNARILSFPSRPRRQRRLFPIEKPSTTRAGVHTRAHTFATRFHCELTQP